MRFDGVEDAGILPELATTEPGVNIKVRGPGDEDWLTHQMGTADIATTQVYPRKLDRASAIRRFRGLS